MKLCNVIDDFQAYNMGIFEHQINFAHGQVVSGPRQMFQLDTTLLMTVGHNIHDNFGCIQEGGIMILVIDEIT